MKERLLVSLEDRHKDCLREFAETSGMSMANVIRQLIDNAAGYVQCGMYLSGCVSSGSLLMVRVER